MFYLQIMRPENDEFRTGKLVGQLCSTSDLVAACKSRNDLWKCLHFGSEEIRLGIRCGTLPSNDRWIGDEHLRTVNTVRLGRPPLEGARTVWPSQTIRRENSYWSSRSRQSLYAVVS